MATSVANFDLARQVLRMSNQGQGFLTASPTDAVFVCIDCEASEWDQQKVTELGVAVLDTKDLAGTAPGQYGEEWIKEMNYAHFRPVEYAHVVNRRFVKGAEDRFAFGDSTWINIQDAATILLRIFQCPERLLDVANFANDLPDSKRNIIFVAHGLSNDDEYMSKLGYKLSQARNVVRQVDSQRVAGGTKKRSIGLRRLLDKLGVPYQGLHNGGNDAAYTLQALIVMAVKEQQQPGLIFGPDNLPSITLPGPVRAAELSAPHVYGGTAVMGKDELPIDGGKAGRKWPFKRATGTKKGVDSEKIFSTASPATSGRAAKKRPAPVDDSLEEQPVRKKPAG